MGLCAEQHKRGTNSPSLGLMVSINNQRAVVFPRGNYFSEGVTSDGSRTHPEHGADCGQPQSLLQMLVFLHL